MRGVGVGRRLLSSKTWSAPIYQFDSFARRPFAGNPAAVVPLERWPSDDETLRSIAAENNLSETAFIVPAEAGADANYALRWFTPTVEVDMCGHATLASAALVLQRLQPSWAEVSFSTRSGILSVRRAADDAAQYVMDPPLWPAGDQVPPAADLVAAVGAAPTLAHTIPPPHGAPYVLFLYDDEAAIRGLAPDLGAMTANVVATAPAPAGAPYDFVEPLVRAAVGHPRGAWSPARRTRRSRFWAERLGKPRLDAKQLPARGGELTVELGRARPRHRRRLHVPGGDDPRAGVGRSRQKYGTFCSLLHASRAASSAQRRRNSLAARGSVGATMALDNDELLISPLMSLVVLALLLVVMSWGTSFFSKMQEVPMHAWEVLNVFRGDLFDTEARKALLGVGGLGGLRSLVGMTADPDPATQSKAASAFVSLLELAARGMEELPDAQLEAVVHLAGKYTPRTRAHAAVAIGNAALSSSTREKLVACGGLKAVLELSAVDDAEVQAAAALALALLRSRRRRARRCSRRAACRRSSRSSARRTRRRCAARASRSSRSRRPTPAASCAPSRPRCS